MQTRQIRLPVSRLGMLPTVVGVALLLAAIAALGLLRWPNLLVYDVAIRATIPHQHTARVVLVETPGALFRGAESTLPELVGRLRQAGASQVLLLAPDTGMTPAAAARLTEDPAVAWGRPTRLQRADAGGVRLHVAPWTLPDSGIVTPPLTEFGTARALPLSGMTDEGPRRSAVASIALAAGHDTTAPLVWINFNSGREQLPRVTAGQVLAGTLPQALFAGRVAVVGAPLEEYDTAIITPRSPLTGPVSPAEFQALALDTLLGDARIHFVQGMAAVLTVLAIFLLHVVLFQRLSVMAGAALAVATLTLAGVATLAGLSELRTFLPFAEIALAIAGAHALVHIWRGQREDREIADLHASLRNKINARRFIAGFHDSEQPWQQLILLVNQHLTLSRSIFLEAVPGDHRVREIASINCSINDISERRRDFQRTPYSAALREELPLVLAKPYFNALNPAEREFMAALTTHGGEVLGFWAFTVIPDAHWNREQFLSNTQAFAAQISELLWQRHLWREKQARQQELPRRLLTADLRPGGFCELRHSLSLIETRLDTLEDIFNGMSTAAALYDLFGHVVQGNARMESLARAAGLRLYDMPAVDLLCAATGCNADEARARLRYAVVQRLPVEVSTQLPGIDGVFLLRLRALQHDDNHNDTACIGGGPQQPFALLGILIELVDVTASRESMALARDLGEHVLRQIASAVREGMDRDALATLVDAAATLVDRSLQPVRDVALPLDVGHLLRRVVDRNADRLARARVTTELALPDTLPLVFGDVVQLERTCEDALDLLLADAPADTRIKATATMDGEGLRITLAGNGFGIPQDKVDAVFRDAATPAMSTPLGRLRGARDRLSAAGSALAVASAPGEGFRVTLTLQPFRLGDRAL